MTPDSFPEHKEKGDLQLTDQTKQKEKGDRRGEWEASVLLGCVNHPVESTEADDKGGNHSDQKDRAGVSPGVRNPVQCRKQRDKADPLEPCLVPRRKRKNIKNTAQESQQDGSGHEWFKDYQRIGREELFFRGSGASHGMAQFHCSKRSVGVHLAAGSHFAAKAGDGSAVVDDQFLDL